MMRTVEAAICLIAILQVVVSDSNVTAGHRIYSSIFKDYNKKVLPPQQNGAVVNVVFNVFLISINDFDERSGTLSLVLMLFIGWNDQALVWSPPLYDNLRNITVPQKNVWLPELFNLRVSNRFEPIGSSEVFKVTIEYNGDVQWVPGALMMVKCAPDVTKYPFDTQICEIHLTPWGYTDKEIRLITQKTEIDTEYYEKNGEWEIVRSFIHLETKADDFPIAVVQLTLKRIPLFYFVNYVFPVILIAMLNPLVFILPCESGERTSYSLTILLSFTVFMMVVSSALPPTSEPMSALCYFVVGSLTLSSTIATINIFQLRMFYRDGSVPVPKYLRLIALRCCGQNKTHPEKNTTSGTNVTWQDVVNTLDIIHMIVCYVMLVTLILAVFITISKT